MGFLFQCGAGWGRRVVPAVAMLGLGWGVARAAGPANAWDAAVKARERFEAEPAGTHTKAEYAQVMDGFRVIYHSDPGAAHAPRAVEQVAELLAEQGRELGDRKSLRDAAGQYCFLAKAYPGGALAEHALESALALLGPDAANDAVELAKVKAELAVEYPRAVVAGAPAGLSTAPSQKREGSGREDKVVVAAANAPAPVVREAAPIVRETAPAARVAAVVVPEKPMAGSAPAAMVTGIRHWSTATYTRVAIDLDLQGDDDAMRYEAARVEHPDRIFFDLHHAKLAPQLAGKSFAVTDDGFLTRVRAAQFSDDITRVVLDVHEVAEYSAFLLPNPTRLIIDIHGKQGPVAGAQLSADELAVSPQPAAIPAAQAREAVHPAAEAGGPVEVSSLPPMPVTDGSLGFGLPAKSAQAKTVAAPRVVISSKPTTARPVPNTVAKSSSDNGSEVAAVSQQPGKVEATSHPTARPVVSGSTSAGDGDHYQKPVRTAAAPPLPDTGHAVAPVPAYQHRDTKQTVAAIPVEAAPPTADGETLVRALGLKIGRIVIDAGHGGHDSGTLGVGGIEEKDVVLDVALRLGKLLHDRLGAEIVYTRADDTFIPLETRTAIANKAQADLFISVHANSSQDPSARGVEVYYLNFTSDPEAMKVASRENAVSTQSVHELSDLVKKIALKDKIDESKELATDVDMSLFAGLTKGNPGLKDRGVKKAPFVVLIGANMPSILAEISFVTNPSDAEQLERPEYRERVAESLYGGVARYAAGINGPAMKVAGTKTKTTERAAVR
jgi:N-acetylmuramoyl-L-alanine amidase